MAIISGIVSNPQNLTALTATLSTRVTTPQVVGGTGTTSTLTLQTTTGAGTTNSAIIFKGGNNGSYEFARFIDVGAGARGSLNISCTNSGASTTALYLQNSATATSTAVALAFSLSTAITTTSAYILATRTNSPGGGATKLDIVTNNGSGNVVAGTFTESAGFAVGNAAIATNATDGFLWMPSCAGTPTGVPVTYTGRVASVYDSTNNKIYVYNGAWKATAALT